MSLELLTAVASVGTFLVILATAITAIVQLHHSRGGNQIIALTEIREVVESEKFVTSRHFIVDQLPILMREPGFNESLKKPLIDKRLEPLSYVGNIFENLGSLVKYRIIDREIACDIWGGVVLATWESLLPVTTVRRQRARNFAALWENFEYLAVLSEDFIARHPDGAFPKGVRRMPEAAPVQSSDLDRGS